MKLTKYISLISVLLLWLATASTLAMPTLNKVNIGDLKTTKGKVIKNTLIGYRTLGKLNRNKSNAVLWPIWFGGNSEDVINSGIINQTMNTQGLYIIIVDALANGVSSSPSNTPDFPAINIADMVNSQHTLLTKHMGITQLQAIVGISMGGMQALQWAAAYPRFMDKVISIVGTPVQSSFDILVWQTQAQLIESASATKTSSQLAFAKKRAMDIFYLHATTPTGFANSVAPHQLDQHMAMNYQNLSKFAALDYMATAKAMIEQDIYKVNNIKPADIGYAIKADVLLIVAKPDHLVNPLSSIALANKLNSKLVVLKGDNGHMAPFVQTKEVLAAVSGFMATN